MSTSTYDHPFTYERLAELDIAPMQARILMLMGDDVEQEWSAKTLSDHFRGPSLGAVSYHVRTLVRKGYLRKTREQRVRGAIATFYKVNLRKRSTR